VHCGAIPETLIESELFGHEKGAFTGAVKRKQGRFALASGGTIFLDEIGTYNPAIQIKLLQFLQDHTFQPVGSESIVEG
jgi:transcriptional regulator with GAF, ATPase, and Fis domain